MVSVVIPVYKTEKYLDKCVESVVNQTFSDLEILLVDDGSPDSCPWRCDGWAQRDKRIRVIHKANQGLGMARNTGIENAAGDCICFLDSDDYLAPEAIDRAVAQRADVAVYGFASVSEGGEVLSRRIPKGAVYREKAVLKEFLPKFLAGEDGLQMSACWALFSMELVRRANWRFPSEREIISEDVYALLGLFRYVRSAAVVPEALYFYRRNAASLTRAYRADRFEKGKDFYGKCLALCRECGYSEDIERKCWEPFLDFTVAAMKRERDPQRLKGIIDDPLLQHLLREKRRDGWKRRLLFGAVRRRQYSLCRLLLAAQNRKDAWQ